MLGNHYGIYTNAHADVNTEVLKYDLLSCFKKNTKEKVYIKMYIALTEHKEYLPFLKIILFLSLCVQSENTHIIVNENIFKHITILKE